MLTSKPGSFVVLKAIQKTGGRLRAKKQGHIFLSFYHYPEKLIGNALTPRILIPKENDSMVGGWKIGDR